jgi:DNA-binding CsgD family transcriptional regulator
MQATVYEVGSDRELTYISPGPVCGHPSQLFHDDPAYWRRIVHPDDVEFAAGGLRRGFEGHGEVVQDLRVLRPDGTLAWARNHLVPYVEADGSRTWIGIVLDITGLKEAEETAHVASQQLRLAVEHAGVVPYAYRSGEARTEPGGTGWPLTVHPDDAAGFGAAHERAERAGNQVSAEFRHLAPDGGWRWALARASRVPGTAAGERPWVSGLLVDTTADHALREQRDRVHARLTARELDVFWLLGTGATNREIADALVISPHTAVRHVTQVLAKLELPNRSAVAALADRLREDSGE